MALVHEFEKTGNWLFRRRSWLPVVLVVSGLAMMNYVNRLGILFDTRKELVFLGISIIGEVIRIITVGFAAGNTSGRNTVAGQIADVVNVTGLYSIVRHPLYIGNFLMWLGPALFLRSAWFAIVFILVYWLYYERIMFAEEQFLRKKFGGEYDIWSEKVKAVVPSFRNYIPPSLPFSWKAVFNREYNSFVNIFLIFLALDFVRNYIVTRRIMITPLWAWLAGGAVVIWFIFWALDHFTEMFRSGGR